jgi:PAS domain S-box-containing protein
MIEFLQGQLDYIFFFYGLAFIGLAVACFTLSEGSQRLPWRLIGWFGLLHGISEWLDLVAIRWGGGAVFDAFHLAILAVSFAFLVEFGRSASIRIRGRGPGRWLPGLLALVAVSGSPVGWAGINITTRYALGLVGGLWTGVALCLESRKVEGSPCRWLAAAAAGWFLYSLASGMFVPKASFFPASIFNQDNFNNLTGIPVQLFRGLLALWIAAMTMGYFNAVRPKELGPYHLHRTRYLYGTWMALIVILISGWMLTQFMGNLARERIHKDKTAYSKVLIQRLVFELTVAQEAVKSMSASPWIGPALWYGKSLNLEQANSVLDRYKKSFNASVAYLLDSSGNTIASSNRGDPDSFVGQTYAFRPYFQQAMGGNTGRYFALGVTSQKRGFYASSPVYDQLGQVAGVAVLKMDIDKYEADLRSIDPAFLVDANGMVFLGSRPDQAFKSLGPVLPGKLAALAQLHGTDRFPAILQTEPADGAVVKFDNTHFLVCRTGFDSPAMEGWSLVSLVSKDLVFLYRLVGITAAFVMVVLTLVFVGSNVYIKEEANRTFASEARFRAMFDAAPEAVFVFDPETGAIVDANPYMAKWLGYSQEELIGMQIGQILAPEGANTQQSINFLREEVISYQRYRGKDGVLINVETTRARILLLDKVLELVFVRDITTRKQAEELHRIRLELFEFSASHSLEALLQKTLDEVGALTNSPIGFYHFVESDQKTLTLQAWSTQTVKEFCKAEGKGLHYSIDQAGVWVDCVHERRPVIHNDYSTLPHRKGMPAGHAPVIRELVAPIMRSGRIVAILGIGNKPEDYTEKDAEVVSFLGDVTWTIVERKLAQQALSDSEERLTLSLAAAKMGVWEWDVRTNTVFWSPECYNIFGVKSFGGKLESFRDLVHPEDRDRIWLRTKQAMEERTVFEVEFRIIQPGGNVRWLTDLGQFEYDADGQPLRLVGNTKDITERKQAEEALSESHRELHETALRLEQSRNMLQLVVESIPVRIFWKDRDLRYLGCNTIFARDAGLSRTEELLGLDDFAMGWREQAEFYQADDRKVMESGLPRLNIVEQQSTPTGAKIWLNTSKAPLFMPNGEVFGILGIYEDITERKQAEEERARVEDDLVQAKRLAEAANNAKSEFLANMSHEIRTPMNAIIGMTDLALETDLTDEQREYLEIIGNSGGSLMTLINNMLDFSKIESKKLDLDPIEFNLPDSLVDTLRPLVERAQAKGVELVYQIQAGVPDILIGDPGRLRQVLMNLAGNAVKFTEQGEIVLDVEKESETEGKLCLRFTLTDTGIGIPFEKQTSIFEPFTQADGSTTRKYGGSGLGLAISRHLVEMMGGDILVASQPGVGSTFRFRVSFEQPKTLTLLSIDLETVDVKDLTVLVVDDNAVNRRLLKEILSKWNMKPTLAPSGKTALEVLEQAQLQGTRFDLILLDVMMPEMDGFETAARIRSRFDFYQSVIMILTSVGQRGDAARCRELGISAYLTKPIKQIELFDAILIVLALRNQDAEHRNLITRHSLRRTPSEPAVGSSKSLHILLAEDNVVNQKVATKILANWGHSIVVASNGKEAVDACEKERFDLIFMDVQMPDLDGFEATQIIRAGEKDGGWRLPIVAMTAHAMKGDKEKCLAAGMDDYVSKPINRDELFSVIEKFAKGGEATGNSTPLSSKDDEAFTSGVFDIAGALEIAGGDKAFLKELADLFLENFPGYVAKIQEAISMEDSGALEGAAHDLKGSVGNFAAKRAYNAAYQLEVIGNKGTLADADQLLSELMEELSSLECAIKSALPE